MTTTERDRGIVRPAIGAALGVVGAGLAAAGAVWDTAVDRSVGARVWALVNGWVRRG